MRNAFADEILKLADHDDRIVLLSGDIGNRMFDCFKAAHPDRFYNVGVAEQNMIGMAAGLAMTGLRPVCYTIASFLTYRCFEQIRVDVCYQRQPVTLVGVGAGLSYASLGPTHHACEDIAIMRSLPGMQVVCPGDAMEVRGAVTAALQQGGPAYIRMGKKNEPVIHREVPRLKIGRSINLRGRHHLAVDVTLLSTGNLLPTACEAADVLSARGYTVRLESFHTVKPLDERCLHEVFERSRLVTTIEEHSRIGGLGGAVAEWRLSRDQRSQGTGGYGAGAQREGVQPSGTPLMQAGTSDAFFHEAGSQEHARRHYGLTADQIVARVIQQLESGSHHTIHTPDRSAQTLAV